jgi:iron-sulfur cluster assembly protein
MLAESTKTQVISMTPTAVQAVRDLMEERKLEGYALRVFVSGGGCSGLQYGMALEANIREQDSTTEFDGVKVVVDEVSIDYLRGATVDFIKDETGSGFKIENPNALSSCGCGSSCGDDAGASGCGSCH